MRFKNNFKKFIIKFLFYTNLGCTIRDKVLIFLSLPLALLKKFLSCFRRSWSNLRIFKCFERKTVKLKYRGFVFNIWLSTVVGSLLFSEKCIEKYFNKSHGVFIDVGAFIGEWSILLAKYLKNGKIISIEAHPENYRLLLKNIHENSLSNVIPLHIAAWNKKKKLKLFVHERPCHSLKIKGKDFIIVNGETIDNIVKKFCKRLPVTFIKIDVEGAEVEVIEGALTTIKKYRPTIIFESFKRENLEKIKRILSSHGYSIKSIDKSNYIAKVV